MAYSNSSDPVQGSVAITINHALTIVLCLLTSWLIYSFYFSGDLPFILAGGLFCRFAQPLCRDLFVAIGKRIGTEKALTKDKSGRCHNLDKFADQGWELVTHTVFSICELYILSNVDWIYDGFKMFTVEREKPDALFRGVYLMQIIVYTLAAFHHRFQTTYRRRKDYFVMFAHHITTSLLLTLSYISNWERIGIAVVCVHDVSDIAVDLLKMSNYMKLDSESGLYITEGVFVIHMIVWMITRLIIFPCHLIYAAVFQSDEMCLSDDLDKTGWGIEAACSAARASLVLLFLMHIYWYMLFLKMVIGLLKGHRAHETAGANYEGDSDDEGEPQEAKKLN